jgi:hypothetical protein
MHKLEEHPLRKPDLHICQDPARPHRQAETGRILPGMNAAKLKDPKAISEEQDL